MHGHEKSDSAVVATKPANKAERSAAEPVERRAGTTCARQTRSESVFATVRYRTVRTKGALSGKTAKLMVFKLVDAALKAQTTQ
jgi:hypothetical protein